MLNDSIDNLRLDINKPKARASISVRKGDTKTRTIHISLVSNGAVYSLENVLTAELLIKKPDGKECDQDMVIKGNELQYTFRTQDTNVAGECLCQVRLTFKDGAYLTSPQFFMYVYNMVLDNNTTQSENEYSHAEVLLTQANEYYENAESLSGKVLDAQIKAESAQALAESAQTGAEDAQKAAEDAQAIAEASLLNIATMESNVTALEASAQQALLDAQTEAANAQNEAANAANSASAASNILASVNVLKGEIDNKAIEADTSATNAKTAENAAKKAQKAAEDAAANAAAVAAVSVATTSTAGIVKPDGTTIKVKPDGTIEAVAENAASTLYDNTVSKLNATNTQDAIDELTNKTDDVEKDLQDAINEKQDKCISVVKGDNISIDDAVDANMVLNGAPKNLLSYTLDDLKKFNTDGSWKDNVYTLYGVTFTVNDDMSILVNGTATTQANLKLIKTMSPVDTTLFKRGEKYRIYAFAPHKVNQGIFINFTSPTVSDDFVHVFSNAEIEIPKDTIAINDIRIRIGVNETVSNTLFKPMITLASDPIYNTYVRAQYDITSCGKNLFPIDATRLVAKNGITPTLNADGSIRLVGTASAGAGFDIQYRVEKLLPNGNYVYSVFKERTTTESRVNAYVNTYASASASLRQICGFLSDSLLEKAFTVTDEDVYFTIGIYVESGRTVDCMVYPMIRLATDEDDTYEPYKSSKVTVASDTVFPLNGLKSFSGVTNVINPYNADMEVVYAIDDTGVSVLNNAWKLECDNAQNLLPNNAVTQTINGVTYTVNSDGSISVNGTATNWANLQIAKITLDKGYYIVSEPYSSDLYYAIIKDNLSGELLYDYTRRRFLLLEKTTVVVLLTVKNKSTINNVTVYPMLEKGSVAHPYKPYKDSFATNNALTQTISDRFYFTIKSAGTYSFNLTNIGCWLINIHSGASINAIHTYIASVYSGVVYVSPLKVGTANIPTLSGANLTLSITLISTSAIDIIKMHD